MHGLAYVERSYNETDQARGCEDLAEHTRTSYLSRLIAYGGSLCHRHVSKWRTISSVMRLPLARPTPGSHDLITRWEKTVHSTLVRSTKKACSGFHHYNTLGALFCWWCGGGGMLCLGWVSLLAAPLESRAVGH